MSVDLSIDGPIAHLLLNRPGKGNSLTVDSIDQVHGHLQRLENDPGVRALVITGAGDRTFCSGMSLSQIRDGGIDSEAFESMAGRLAALPLPKIAAMNGNAYGGGVEIGLCCDFRIGVTGMKIMVPAVKFGLCYPPRGIRRYVDRLGAGPAKRILAAAETIEAAELMRIGYLQEICSSDELQSRAGRLARHLSELAPLAVSAVLRICDGAAAGSLADDRARQWVDRCNRSSDLQEGLQAALEKRQPEFKGR